MTLAEEKELEIIREGLTYVEEDSHSKSPHRDTKYPWIQDPATLPYNKVEWKELKRLPEWLDIYAVQVHDMVERRAATKLTKEVIDSWNGPIWYVSHLVAPTPLSTTTPVWLVWNRSQKFKGLSMYDLLLKGPDVLNPIRAVFNSGRECLLLLETLKSCITLSGWKSVKCTFTSLERYWGRRNRRVCHHKG